MTLDLRGKTVSEAIAEIRGALARREGEALLARTDNETVKLNLIREISRMGLQCRSEREGGSYRLRIEGERPPARVREHGGHEEPDGATAFPIAHLSGAAPTESSTESPGGAQPKPREGGVRSLLLVLQSDQIGNRDPNLGFELLEELIEHLDTTRYVGIFLVHRAVTLLDPALRGGRGLRVLLRKNLPLTVCERSVAYYDLDEKAVAGVNLVPFHTIGALAERHDLVWV